MVLDTFLPFEEVHQIVDRFVADHSAIARGETLGLSEEGREIKVVFVTDPDIPECEKQVAFVICGRHGQELGTRVIGPTVLDWLASDAGAETRRRQVVAVVPVANPDGCVREEFWAPNDGLSRTEEETIGELADRYHPDAVIDVHSWGGVLDGEAMVAANTTGFGEDVAIYESMAAKMVESGAAKGYPFALHRMGRRGGYNNFYCGMCYERFHSLVFGLEVNHVALKPHQTAESGMAVIGAFLEAGNVTAAWEREPGYPNGVLLGEFWTSIRPMGRNAAERRESRCAIWRNRQGFTVPKRECVPPSTIAVKTEYSGEEACPPFALVSRIRRIPEVKSVRLNGREIETGRHEDTCSTYLWVEVDEATRRRNEVLIRM